MVVVVVVVVVVGSGDSIDHNRSCNRQLMNSVLGHTSPHRRTREPRLSPPYLHREVLGDYQGLTDFHRFLSDFLGRFQVVLVVVVVIDSHT